MDWSKAKTILIVAFLITNLLLVGVLVTSGRQVETTIKEEFIADVTRLLGDKDISINTEIPKKIPSLNTLTVEYENINSQEVNKDFFGGKGSVDSSSLGMTNIIYENEYIKIVNKKRLIYENKGLENKYQDLDRKKAEEIVLEFLKERNYNINDMKLSYIKEEDNKYYLEMANIYNNRYLETSFTSAIVDERGVTNLERIWLTPLEEGETPIFINTAPKAILTLLGMEEVYGKTIKDISLCYYFDPEEQDYLQDPIVVRKGKTIPAWRILFEDGYKVVIDNY